MTAINNDSHAGAKITRLYEADHLQRMQNEHFYKATTIWGESSSPQCFEYITLHVGSIRIVKARKIGNEKIVIRRTWEDIRQDDTNYFTLTFPVKGEISLNQNNVSCLADNGSLVTGYSNKPMITELLGDDGYAESYNVIIPTFEINNYLPHLDKVCGETVSTSDPAVAIAKKTFIQLFEYGNRLPKQVADSYISTSMASLASTLNMDCRRRVDEANITTVRFKNLLEYIDCHLSDSELTASLVASKCGISTRYLYKLFKIKGMSFNHYLVNARLEYAHHWLMQDKSKQQTVENIAYISGFGTASHFGRAFKSKYGCTPSEARKALNNGLTV